MGWLGPGGRCFDRLSTNGGGVSLSFSVRFERSRETLSTGREACFSTSLETNGRGLWDVGVRGLGRVPVGTGVVWGRCFDRLSTNGDGVPPLEIPFVWSVVEKPLRLGVWPVSRLRSKRTGGGCGTWGACSLWRVLVGAGVVWGRCFDRLSTNGDGVPPLQIPFVWSVVEKPLRLGVWPVSRLRSKRTGGGCGTWGACSLWRVLVGAGVVWGRCFDNLSTNGGVPPLKIPFVSSVVEKPLRLGAPPVSRRRSL